MAGSQHPRRAGRDDRTPAALNAAKSEAGYIVTATGDGERLPRRSSKKFALTSSGAFEPTTENSTKPIADRPNDDSWQLAVESQREFDVGYALAIPHLESSAILGCSRFLAYGLYDIRT